MQQAKALSSYAVTLLRRHESRPSLARIKILRAIDQLEKAEFTRIDIYKKLVHENEPVSLSAVTSNLKRLNKMGMLISKRHDIASRLYSKGESFMLLLTHNDDQPER